MALSRLAKEQGYPYVERIEGGHAERVQLDQRLGGDTDRFVLCALPSGELLGLSDIEVYRFSAEGATIQKYAVPGGASMAVYNNEVAICSTSNSLISILDIETGETLRMIPLPGEADYGVVGYNANGALYYVCPDGLYQANAGSTMLVQIADGKLMTAGKSNIEARALLFDPENNPIIAYSQGGSLSLIAYHYDENVPTEPNNLLSVYALYDIWLRILGYFIMGMLLLTILSRAADSIMLPAVKTTRPLPGALTHTVILNGTVEAKELSPVIAADGLIVASVHVRAGQSVKAGDTLLSYDMEALQSELQSKKTALERVTLEAKRQTTGNASEQNSDLAETERRLLRLDIDAAQAEVDRINALIANGGILAAPVDGMIAEVLIQPGEVASGVAFRMAAASSGMIVRASVNETQWPYLQIGMEGSVQRQGENQRQRVSATISELVPSASGYEAVFELPSSAWSVGQALTITLTQTTDTYDMRVPTGAIVENNGNKGVYRIRTGDSVLGEVEYAEFVPVKVLETDSQYAAIEATLSDRDQIITSSSKPVNDQDRVRSTK